MELVLLANRMNFDLSRSSALGRCLDNAIRGEYLQLRYTTYIEADILPHRGPRLHTARQTP